MDEEREKPKEKTRGEGCIARGHRGKERDSVYNVDESGSIGGGKGRGIFGRGEALLELNAAASRD